MTTPSAGWTGKRTVWIAAFIFMMAAFYMICILIGQQSLIRANREKIAYYREVKTQETEKQTILTEKGETILTDEYIEKLAREKLGLIIPGEKVFIAVGIGN